MPVDIILYALIAAGLIFWLNSILGTRNGEEPNHHDLQSSDHEENTPLRPHNDKKPNVVSLNAHVGDKFFLPHHVKIENKTAENKLLDIAKKHPEFDLEHFAGGVSNAFAIVVESFAEGDRDTLKELLAEPVYNAFNHAIDEREKREEKVITQIQAVKKADIIKAEQKENTIFLTVRFTAKEICVIRDKNDEIIAGHPEKATEMTDVWIFGRELDAEGPEWLIYETLDDAVEDHKTPMPESSDSEASKPDPEKK